MLTPHSVPLTADIFQPLPDVDTLHEGLITVSGDLHSETLSDLTGASISGLRAKALQFIGLLDQLQGTANA